MKSLLCSLFAFFCALPACAQWEWLGPHPQGDHIRDLDFVDSQTGWGIAGRGTLLATTDGGMTWDIGCRIAPILFNELEFVDYLHGWVVGRSRAIYATVDGGGTWQPQSVPIDQGISLNDIGFWNKSVGWSVGTKGTVLQTLDGGMTWTLLPFPEKNASLVKLHVVGDKQFWVAGNENVLYFTPNGGKNWIRQCPECDLNYNDIYFVDADNGWVIGENSVYQPAIYRTTNGGLQWTKSYTWTFDQKLYPLTSVFFLNKEIGWAGGLGGNLWRTTDGGTAWNQIFDYSSDYPGGNPHVYGALLTEAISFSDAENGVMAGTFGYLLWTSDGGSTWYLADDSKPGPPLGGGVAGVAFRDSNYGLAFSQFPDTGLFETYDGGYSWQSYTSFGDSLHKSIVFNAFFLDSHIWLMGMSGLIYHSSDNGKAWSRQSVNSRATLYRMDFADPDNGWIISNWDWTEEHSLPVFRTTNGGQEWKTAFYAGQQTYDVSFTGNQKGFIAADSGRVYHTRNGGISWDTTILTTPLYAGSRERHYPSLYCVKALNSDTVIAAGDRGLIFRSTNGGVTWIYDEIDQYERWRDVDFADDRNGWIVGHSGSIYRTTDAGAHWHSDASPTVLHLDRVVALDTEHIWVVGDIGTLLRRDPSCRPQNSSSVVDVLPGPVFATSLLPNPSLGRVHLSFVLDRSSEISVRLYSAAGVQVGEEYRYNLHQGTHRMPLNTAGLSPGIYFVRVDDRTTVQTFPLVLVH